MIRIRIEFDASATEAELARTRAALSNREEVNAVVEIAAEKVVKEHLLANYANKPNRLSAPPTGYWKQAIEATRVTSDDAGVTVAIEQIGIRIKYYGGVIRPSGRPSEVTGKPIRWLTIPIHMGAHGKSIMDLGGKKRTYLQAQFVKFKPGAQAQDSDPRYFIFKKSVTIKPDPNILPPDEAIVAECVAALNSLMSGFGTAAPE